MNCSKCDFNLPDNSKFCPKCGEKVVIIKKIDEKKEVTVGQDIANHLEFLGYKVTKEDISENETNGKYLFLAKHQKLNNVVFFNILDNSIIFKVTLTTVKKMTNEMFKYVNLANEKYLNFCKVFVNENEDNKTQLVFEVVYSGGYNKEVFSEFFNEFTADQQRFSAGENFDKLFIG